MLIYSTPLITSFIIKFTHIMQFKKNLVANNASKSIKNLVLDTYKISFIYLLTNLKTKYRNFSIFIFCKLYLIRFNLYIQFIQLNKKNFLLKTAHQTNTYII